MVRGASLAISALSPNEHEAWSEWHSWIEAEERNSGGISQEAMLQLLYKAADVQQDRKREADVCTDRPQEQQLNPSNRC